MTPPIRRIPGICHWSEGDRLLRSRGPHLELSDDNGRTFRRTATLPLPAVKRLASVHRLGRRLLRTGVKHVLRVAPERWIVFGAGAVHALDSAAGTLEALAPVHGSRPLSVCFDGSALYYGEYRSNPERSPVHLWRSDDLGRSWRAAATLSGVRHIHAVQRDPHDGALWLTTGDLDQECALWRLENGAGTPQRIVGGTQGLRAIHLLFEPDRILYGMDAPDRQNWICSVRRDGSAPERLWKMPGPVFHACTVAGQHYFSSACEPGCAAQSHDIDVVRYSAHGTVPMARYRKDRWHMKYFQYGQASFAAGPGNGEGLWVSPFATAADQCSDLLPLR